MPAAAWLIQCRAVARDGFFLCRAVARHRFFLCRAAALLVLRKPSPGRQEWFWKSPSRQAKKTKDGKKKNKSSKKKNGRRRKKKTNVGKRMHLPCYYRYGTKYNVARKLAKGNGTMIYGRAGRIYPTLYLAILF